MFLPAESRVFCRGTCRSQTALTARYVAADSEIHPLSDPEFQPAERMRCPDKISVEILPNRSVTARLYPAATHGRAGVTLILGPGAGAGQTSAFIVEFATGLAARGIDAVTFNFCTANRAAEFPIRTTSWSMLSRGDRGRSPADDVERQTGWRSAASRWAGELPRRWLPPACADLAGLVFLGYPLHPPGRPDRLRAAHLPDIKAPMLFRSGLRATPSAPLRSFGRSCRGSSRHRIFMSSLTATTRSKCRRGPASHKGYPQRRPGPRRRVAAARPPLVRTAR